MNKQHAESWSRWPTPAEDHSEWSDVRQEQETDTTVHTGSPRLDKRRFRFLFPSISSSGFWFNNVWDIFMAHFQSLNTNWVSCKHHSLPGYWCWPRPSLHDHSVQIRNWSFEHGNRFQGDQISIQYSNCLMLLCHYVKNLRGMIPAPCWVCAMMNEGSSEGIRGPAWY